MKFFTFNKTNLSVLEIVHVSVVVFYFTYVCKLLKKGDGMLRLTQKTHVFMRAVFDDLGS